MLLVPLTPDSKKIFPSFQTGEVILAEVVFSSSFHIPFPKLNCNRRIPESATAIEIIVSPPANVSSLINALSGTSKAASSLPFSAFLPAAFHECGTLSAVRFVPDVWLPKHWRQS